MKAAGGPTTYRFALHFHCAVACHPRSSRTDHSHLLAAPQRRDLGYGRHFEGAVDAWLQYHCDAGAPADRFHRAAQRRARTHRFVRRRRIGRCRRDAPARCRIGFRSTVKQVSINRAVLDIWVRHCYSRDGIRNQSSHLEQPVVGPSAAPTPAAAELVRPHDASAPPLGASAVAIWEPGAADA
jgi:hypothetical protein